MIPVSEARLMLPYGRQSIDEEDIQAVCDVLRSDFLTCGPKVEEFEARFAERVGARHAVAVNSATAALHLAMLAAGIGRGHRVMTSPNTFLASANCAAYVGATPDFADIDPVSYNLDPAALERAWQPDVTAVVAVDYAGQACEMPAIAEIARKRGALVIEDACHAMGGAFRHDDKTWRIGGHPWADMTVFSFHPVKTMTTGEGGMLVTDKAEWAAKARQLRAHGIVRDPSRFQGLADASDAGVFDERGPWYYEMQDLGFNYRLTDIQCALGLSQLHRLNAFLQRRRAIVRRYNEELKDLQWLQVPRSKNLSDADLASWHVYTVQMDYDSLGKSRTAVMTELRNRGVGSQVLYIPVHLQPWYRRMYGYVGGKCPIAEAFYSRALSLPLFPALTDMDIGHVVEAVRHLVGK
ncbi:MAG TPA: UDP-4-amino-4,6-dideoxy-N-acetyl-beta-L-altrosamine transaminase [Verrucomicrobiae bacterium]|nr:UDP-4-amino-4,6-dideoxy-N-acetyl-beta-L-altrosamine transaminase [Verrucomicrobiae bacterium]